MWTTCLTEYLQERPSTFCWFCTLHIWTPLHSEMWTHFMIPTVYINLVMWTISDGATLIQCKAIATKYISMKFIDYVVVSIRNREKRIKKDNGNNERNSFDICLLIMATRIDLSLEQKVNLIKDNEQGMSFRQLKDKFHVSVGSISNILKRKNEYLDDYECNKSKKMKRKSTNNFTQEISDYWIKW